MDRIFRNRLFYDKKIVAALRQPRPRFSNIKKVLQVGFFSFGVLKQWNGTKWVVASSKVYNGSTFVKKPLKLFIGKQWVTIASK